MTDVVLPGLVIPDAELVERFSRSSGPGGQSVNTTDSRVELVWDAGSSAVLSPTQRDRLVQRLGDPVITVVASEHRSQRQNRTAARLRLAAIVRAAIEPPAPPRRATRPSRSSRARRVDAKRRRGEIKATRRRPPPD